MKNSIRAVICLVLVVCLFPLSDVGAKERPLFIGDSRTVGILAEVNDMSGDTMKIDGTYAGIDFKCKTSTSYSYLSDVINSNKDRKVIVSWMGVNNLTWSKYEGIYNKVLKDNKKLILLTIGSVDRSKYKGGVTNKAIEKFNEQLLSYADKNKIQVIDAYSYLQSNGFETWDGLHYKGSTNNGLYEFIVSELNSIG